jgi:hypothetical protein
MLPRLRVDVDHTWPRQRNDQTEEIVVLSDHLQRQEVQSRLASGLDREPSIGNRVAARPPGGVSLSTICLLL